MWWCPRHGRIEISIGLMDADTRDTPWFELTATVLDSPDPRALAAFYCRLLGYEVRMDEPTWVSVAPPGGGAPRLSFQYEPLFQRPTWPSRSDEQQMMTHLDIEVRDLAAAGAHAESLGATLAEFQPQKDVRVWLDPDGHPFCLWVNVG
jgi:catechol 2,3-dioxygenase-like lactoylglutathione lyase family enzyme